MTVFISLVVYSVMFVLFRAFLVWERPDFNPGHWSTRARGVFILCEVLVIVIVCLINFGA